LLLTKGQHGRKYASPKPKRDEDDIISLSSVFVPFPAGNSYTATDQSSTPFLMHNFFPKNKKNKKNYFNNFKTIS
jgi:hypothetical protein